MVNDEASMTGDRPTDADPSPAGEKPREANPSPTSEKPTDTDPSSTGEAIVLNETIHQPTRLRIMTLLVSVPEADRLAYGFIQKTLDLTGGNLTIHLRKLQDAGYLDITKEFQGSKPRTWIQSTTTGRQAFTEYLSNLERALGVRLHTAASDDRQAGSQ